MNSLVRVFSRLLGVSRDPGVASEVTILLKQISQQRIGSGASSNTEWDISIHCHDGMSARVVSLVDPFMPESEENLRWYLEEFAAKSPFERSRSNNAATELRGYAKTLIRGLDLLMQVQHLRSEMRLLDSAPLIVFLEIEAEIGCANNSIHKIHWEVLEDMSVWPAQTRAQVIVRRKVPNSEITRSVETYSNTAGFNILVVVARDLSRGDEEIGHTLVTAGMVKVIEELPNKTPVNLEIVRPGTWDAFRRHLQSRPKGYFSLVHLDMHGRVRMDSRTGKQCASLCFVSDHNYMKVTWKSSQGVAALLCEHQVSAVILNACNSADMSGESLALTLISYGVPSVVAMSYKFLSEATSLFMSGFYRSLLVDMSSLVIAAHKGRERLLEEKLRGSGYNCQVPLDDHIIPVLYQRESARSLDWAKMEKKDFRLPRHVNAPHRLVGRELDILRLEMGLLTDSNVLLITGRRGVGKTTLLKHLGWWWGITSLIERFHYIDLSESTDSFNQVLAKLHQFMGGWAGPKSLSELLETPMCQSPRPSKIYKQVLQYFRHNRHLLVIDGIGQWEPEVAGLVSDNAMYWDCQRQIMKEFLQDLKGGRGFIIAAVGLNRTWPDWRPYILERLNSLHMRSFVPIDLESLGRDVPDAEFWEFYGKILEYLDGVPGALKYFTFPLPITVESNPRGIYLAMIRIIPGYDGSYTEESQSYALVNQLKEYCNNDPDTFNLLCCLAPFQTRVPIDVQLYLIYLSVNCVFSGRLNLQFTAQSELEECKTRLADSALLAEYKRLVQRLIELDFLTVDECRPDIYYGINPMLTLALRKVVWGQGPLTDSRVSWLITSGFYDYYNSQGNPAYQDLAAHHCGQDSLIQLEKRNIFSLMLSLLEQQQILPMLSILPIQLYLRIILDSFTSSALGPDSFLHNVLASLVILQFDMIRQNAALEDILALYLLAYLCSNNLCFFFTNRGADEFQKQVETSNAFYELGKTLPEAVRHRVLFLDFQAATLTAKAAQVHRKDTSHRLFDTVGDICQGNRAAAAIYRTDPRIISEEPGDVVSGVEPFKRLFRLRQEFWEKKNSQAPDGEKEAIQVAVKSCCDELRVLGNEFDLDPVSVDSWMAEFEASVEIIPYSALLDKMAVAELSGNSLPIAAITRALEQRDAGNFSGAKVILLAALADSQADASPEGEYMSHIYLSELNYVTGKWADAIAHTAEGMQLIDIVKASESESRRQVLQATCRGQNAVCHAHLGQWDWAINEELSMLQLCRQNQDNTVLGAMHYEVLVFLKYLLHKSGRVDIMSAEANKLERYKVLQNKEGLVVDSLDSRKAEEAHSMLCLVAVMIPKVHMAFRAQAILEGIPRLDGIPLFVPTDEPHWWDAVEDDTEVLAELKAYFTLAFYDPESAFFGLDPEGDGCFSKD